MRDKLQEWAGELGYANCEIFPKQIEIQADRGDTGNFLNLPYHKANDSFRHGALLENVVYDADTGIVDYSDSSKTENTRV